MDLSDNVFDVSIFIVTKDNQFINENEYDRRLDGNGEFLMITNERLNPDYGDDSTIFIYNKWKKTSEEICSVYGGKKNDGIVWSAKNMSIFNNSGLQYISKLNINVKDYRNPYKMIEFNLDGYKQTKTIIETLVHNGISEQIMGWYIPAVYGTYSQSIDICGNHWQGYLPTIGQLVFISENVPYIRQVLMNAKMNMIPVHTVKYRGSYGRLGEGFWTSTIWSDEGAMCIIEGAVRIIGYVRQLSVLPLFKMK